MENIIKIGTVELYESEANKMYEDGMYIVTYSKIYQLMKGGNGYPHVYGREIYHKPGMARRGRFHVFSAADVNDLVGHNLVNVPT